MLLFYVNISMLCISSLVTVPSDIQLLIKVVEFLLLFSWESGIGIEGVIQSINRCWNKLQLESQRAHITKYLLVFQCRFQIGLQHYIDVN